MITHFRSKSFLFRSLPVPHFRYFHSPPPSFSNLRFTQDLLSLLSTLSKTPTDPKTLASLDSLLTHSHLLSSAAAVLVLRRLSATKKLTRAKSLLSNLIQRATIPTPFLYSLLLQCLVPKSPIQEVEIIWNEISRNSPINISKFVLYLCRHCDDLPEIERVYARISSSSWNLSPNCYAAMIAAMCRTNNPNPNLGRVILNSMAEKGFEPDEFTYFALFRSFCRIGDVFEADAVLRDWVVRRNCEVDVLIYGNFFYGLCKSGKFREAHKLFDKLTVRDCNRQIELNLPNSNSGLKAGRRVIFQSASRGKISEKMAFEAYFRSLCSVARVDEAEKLLKLAMKKSTVPETCVHSSFIKALFRAGRADDAMRFFENERRKGHVSIRDIAVAVVFGLCEMGRVDDGYELLCEMASDGFVPTSQVWNRVLESYWKIGRMDKAVGLFDAMRSGNCGGCRTRLDAGSYGVMICGFLDKSEIEMAISMLEEMVRKSFKAGVDLYSRIVRCLHDCGRVEMMNEYLNRMFENGILVSYESWESLYDSMTMGGREIKC